MQVHTDPPPAAVANRARPRGWPGMAVLVLALLTTAFGQCSENHAKATRQTTATAQPSSDVLNIDLSFVDHKSPAYSRFRSWVDSAVSGKPGYAFAASDAALMALLNNDHKYCDLAVRMVEQQVADAEAAIAKGNSPEITNDSYLEVGPLIADLAMTLHACPAGVDEAKRKRWSAYAEQAVWNVWHPAAAQWGGQPHPWSGWATDNPGNNYYYSFLEATMYWALVSSNEAWMQDLHERRLPPLKEYFAQLPGGGSREGTGYGVAQMRLFGLYRLWRDSTGENLATASTHAHDSIAYWVHATVPTLDHFAPIGDQSRNSIPELFDYHRRLMLEARQLTDDPDALATSSWWLNNISVPHMSQGFNSRYDLLPAGKGGHPPAQLSYFAEGTGHLFARSSWDRDAMWLSFTAGPYDESHAHQEQGSFTLFARDWLVVPENIWSRSGIQQGTEVHNIVRFEYGNEVVQQHESPESRPTLEITTHANGSLTALADLTPVYRNNPALDNWLRQIDFGGRKLTVRDRFKVASGTRAIFQVNVPVEPHIHGSEAQAGRLHVRVLEPANAVLHALDWHHVDAQEFLSGWRLDVEGGQDGYLVEFSEQ
jgi:hypothetical protein